MDFAKLKENLAPYLGTAKTYGEKALVFTQNQMHGTPIFLKTEEEYHSLIASKRAILIAYDEDSPLAQEVLLRAPVWSTKAWMDNANIRFLSITKNGELARTLGIVGPIEMRVSYLGNEYLRTSELHTMMSWWEHRCYYGDDMSHTNTPNKTTPTEDPLSAMNSDQ